MGPQKDVYSSRDRKKLLNPTLKSNLESKMAERGPSRKKKADMSLRNGLSRRACKMSRGEAGGSEGTHGLI